MAYVQRDSTGQLWQLTVSAAGESVWTQVASGAVLGGDASTITIQDVVNFAATQTELMPLAGVGGYTNEPALTLANQVLQDLLGTYPWKFNAAEMPMLVTQMGKQDYQFAGAAAWTQACGAAIDLADNNAIVEAANVVTVNTLEPHNFTVGDTVYMAGNTVDDYNSAFTQTLSSSLWSGGWIITATPTSKSFTFTHALAGLAVSGASGIFDACWLESATMVGMADTSAPQGIKYLTAVRTLQKASRLGTPDKVSMAKSYGDGRVLIRFRWVPGSAPWGVTIKYQMNAPMKAALTDTWFPFPDDLANVYRQLFLAYCYRHINSARSEVEWQKAQQTALAAQMQNDNEMSEESISPDRPLMDDSYGGIF